MTARDHGPFRLFRDLSQEIEDTFDALIDKPWGRTGQADWTPPMDIEEVADAYYVTVDLPGVQADDIQLYVRPWEIEICGTRTFERASASAARIRIERGRGRFCRTFRLEHEIDPDRASSHCDNGVYRLRIAKQPYRENHAEGREERHT